MAIVYTNARWYSKKIYRKIYRAVEWLESLQLLIAKTSFVYMDYIFLKYISFIKSPYVINAIFIVVISRPVLVIVAQATDPMARALRE